MRSAWQNISVVSFAEWFAGYLVAIAAPQLLLLWVGTIRSFRTEAILGGLVALDTWLIFIEWSIFHSTDYDGVGWLIYLAASLPVAVGGTLLGKAVSGLTRRWS
jgi:hypothetical protein